MTKPPQLKVFLWGINQSMSLMDKQCSRAIESASVFDVKTAFIGIGHEFKEHKQRLRIVYETLSALDSEDVIILMDGSDTLFNDYSHSIIQKFIDFKCKIVVSAEKSFTHQYSRFKDNYDTINSDYRYVNAGTIIGYVGAIRHMFDELNELSKTYPDANDQGLLGIWCSKQIIHSDRIRLDSECKLFWVTTTDHNALLTACQQTGTIVNPHTKISPSIIHVTGHKDPQIAKAYQAGYEKIMSLNYLEFFRVIIISPLIDEDDYYLWKPKDHDYDLNRPIWYHDDHPNIISFFYGISDSVEANLIQTKDYYKAIVWLQTKYVFDYIIHIPKKYIFHKHRLIELIKSKYRKEKIYQLHGRDQPEKENFLYFQGYFYVLEELNKVEKIEQNLIQTYIDERKSYEDSSLLNNYKKDYPEFPTDVISLGGWCGPAVVLNDMRIRVTSYPFGFIHSTLDCIIEVVQGNFEVFFDEGRYTVMPHHDMSNPEEKEKMNIRLKRFINRLQDPKPILFVRALINPDFKDSINKTIKLANLINSTFNRNDKYVLAMHDQNIKTSKIKLIRSDIMLWSVEGSVGWKVPNRGEMFDSYRRVIRYALNDHNWIWDKQQVKNHKLLSHNSYGIHKALYPKYERST